LSHERFLNREGRRSAVNPKTASHRKAVVGCAWKIVDKEMIVLDTMMVKKNSSTNASVSDLKSHTGFWLRFVSNHVSHAFARKLQETGVTVAEWVLLREMYDREEIAPSVLADLTGMTRGAASKLIDRLLAKQLVTRQDRTDDRRFQDVALSASGHKLVPSLAAIADQNDEEFFSVLSRAEREALISTLKKLVQMHELYKFPTE
jgi:DNA-binding MarR family transcriptional regulator